MAISMVFQLMAASDQLLCCVKAANADIFFMPGLAPCLGSQPPADNKKCRLYAVLVENIRQPRTAIAFLAAEKDIRPGTIVKRKGD